MQYYNPKYLKYEKVNPGHPTKFQTIDSMRKLSHQNSSPHPIANFSK